VTQGTGLMPGWGSVLDAEQIGALWSYVIPTARTPDS
jgi:hypothetical protein